jgi:phthalate 4,5-cis-dihydrodiol dehydrogenase
VIDLGIIGMGYTGQQQLRAVEAVAGLRVCAACDVESGRLASLPAGVARHARWEDLLADERVGAVSVCLPHHLHGPVVEAALGAGKHVLVEKPLAVDLEQADRLAAVAGAADAAGQVSMVEMTHRFYPPVQQARAVVRTGRLGRVFAVEERIVQPVREGELPGWIFRRRQAGGGVALTNGVHMLDRIGWVCGQAVRFRSGVAGCADRLGDVEDTASMHLSLADGTPVLLLAAWFRGPGVTDDELTVYGTGGTLRVWAWRGWAFEPAGGAREEHACYPDAADHAARARIGMAGALAEFAAAIAARRPASPGFGEILQVQRLIDRFYTEAGAA